MSAQAKVIRRKPQKNLTLTPYTIRQGERLVVALNVSNFSTLVDYLVAEAANNHLDRRGRRRRPVMRA